MTKFTCFVAAFVALALAVNGLTQGRVKVYNNGGHVQAVEEQSVNHNNALADGENEVVGHKFFHRPSHHRRQAGGGGDGAPSSQKSDLSAEVAAKEPKGTAPPEDWELAERSKEEQKKKQQPPVSTPAPAPSHKQHGEKCKVKMPDNCRVAPTKDHMEKDGGSPPTIHMNAYKMCSLMLRHWEVSKGIDNQFALAAGYHFWRVKDREQWKRDFNMNNTCNSLTGDDYALQDSCKGNFDSVNEWCPFVWDKMTNSECGFFQCLKYVIDDPNHQPDCVWKSKFPLSVDHCCYIMLEEGRTFESYEGASTAGKWGDKLNRDPNGPAESVGIAPTVSPAKQAAAKETGPSDLEKEVKSAGTPVQAPDASGEKGMGKSASAGAAGGGFAGKILGMDG